MRKIVRNKIFRKEVTDYYVTDLIQNWLGFYYVYMTSKDVAELKALVLAWLRDKEKI